MAKKRYPITWTFKARSDLRQVYDYLSDNASPDKALTTSILILDKAAILAITPFLGQKEPLLAKLKREYRRLVIEDY